MKIINFPKYILVAVIAVASSGCQDFLDVNVSPNSPSSVTNAVLLPPIQVGTAWATHNELSRITAPIMQYMAGAAGGPLAYDRYNITQDETGLTNAWRFDFYRNMGNLEEMIRVAETTNSPAYAGVAKLMKAYNFAVVTDIWGDVPYSQALQGEAFPSPRIDSQRDIYLGNTQLEIQSLFDLVREGLADLDRPSTLKPGNEDLMYGGVMDNWKRFGNTLLLKLAIQISNNPEGRPVAQAVIQEVVAKGANAVISTNEQNGQVRFFTTVGAQNPVHQWTNVGSFSNDLLASTRFVTRLQALNDPRLPRIISRPANATTYVTWDNGQVGTLPPANTWARFGEYVTGATTAGSAVGGNAPARLLTNFQRAFILAEAAVRFGIGGDAQALYTEGIRASMAATGVAAADITAYLAANPAVAVLSTNEQEAVAQIITQKYIAWVGNGYEAWNDWRRTGYPELPQAQNAAGVDGTIPRRLPYPSTEFGRNPNMPVPAPENNVKVWWDVR